ncbi:nicotinamide riboside transporter PnuC [Motilimonas sp. KMU-193]|uniref:nicotinamide riboside transporter PnuC n=1 Tax=Motilimonas sp. KMU-193 TaxID=3388668 RepID=UPI00396B2697
MSATSITDNIVSAWQAMSGFEVVAVVLAIAYLVLAIKENSWCWYAAFVSTAIYTWLFWDVSLVMESLLNAYYMAMAVYGWWQWRSPNEQANAVKPIVRWQTKHHLLAFVSVLVLTGLSGYLLTENTGAQLPYLDSFTTWASVLTTYMVAKKVLENWLYWLVINACAIYLYVDRELYLTAMLFVSYEVMAVIGYIRWRNHYKMQQPA